MTDSGALATLYTGRLMHDAQEPLISMLVTTDKKTGRKKYTIYAGDYIFAEKGELIETTLGACIGVCIYCERSQLAAMAHFMLPSVRNSVDESKKDSSLYGVNAVRNLIKGFTDRGEHIEQCRVSLFGGADFVSDQSGSSNITLARILVEAEDLPIAAEDLGGSMVRKIIFDSGTGKVFVQQRKKLRIGEQ